MNAEPDPQIPLQPRPPLGADRIPNCFLLVHEFGVIDQKLLPDGRVLGLVLSLRRPRLVMRLEEVLRLLPNELLSLSLGLASLDLTSSRLRPVIVIVISLIFVCISISISVRVVVVVVVLIATTTIVAPASRRPAGESRHDEPSRVSWPLSSSQRTSSASTVVHAARYATRIGMPIAVISRIHH
jgi:hypothetical protein